MAQSTTVTQHDSHVQHHFVNANQQLDSAKMGMWVFLVTEILFFGGLFAGYTIYRMLYPELFVQASIELDKVWGTVNTLVLIASSVTVALAIRSAQVGKPKRVITYLVTTIILAAVFMTIKYFEWEHKFSLGIYPGKFYSFDGIDNPKAHIFFSFYYLMTGLHGIHVLVGMGLMVWLIIKTKKGEITSDYYNPVEITGLYWHLVDIIWIFLFPLFYLIK